MNTIWTWNCLKENRAALSTRILAFALLCSFLISCAESHSPNTEELVTVQPPTINNTLNNGFLTTPTKNFTISGSCDSTSYGMQYQRDGGAWVDFSPGCVDGSYVLNTSLVKLLTISIRSKSKFRFTSAATVTARFVLPPTSPNIQWVASGITMEENLHGHQMIIPGNGIMANQLTSTVHKIFPNIIGASYDK